MKVVNTIIRRMLVLLGYTCYVNYNTKKIHALITASPVCQRFSRKHTEIIHKSQLKFYMDLGFKPCKICIAYQPPKQVETLPAPLKVVIGPLALDTLATGRLKATQSNVPNGPQVSHIYPKPSRLGLLADIPYRGLEVYNDPSFVWQSYLPKQAQSPRISNSQHVLCTWFKSSSTLIQRRHPSQYARYVLTKLLS